MRCGVEEKVGQFGRTFWIDPGKWNKMDEGKRKYILQEGNSEAVKYK